MKKSNVTSNAERTFKPSLQNMKTSLSYEGLSIKANSTSKTISQLKAQYAR